MKRKGGSPRVSLQDRQSRILQVIVQDYVETAEPIGSAWLVSRHDFGCRSATLRSEMAEMADLGYLVQPHTSAGRIPSDLGYRYYVDRLLGPSELEVPGPEPDASERLRAIEEVVQESCRLLSSMTRYPSVASSPSPNLVRLHRVFLSQATDRHILVVALFSTGKVENRLVELEGLPTEADLARSSNYLNALFATTPLREMQSTTLETLPGELEFLRPLLRACHAALLHVAAANEDDRYYIEGANYLLREREFQNVARIEKLLQALESRSLLTAAFAPANREENLTVVIGRESEVAELRECSLVASGYRVGGAAGGFIGVLGPTRMRYEETMAAVEWMAQHLSEVLTRAALD